MGKKMVPCPNCGRKREHICRDETWGVDLFVAPYHQPGGRRWWLFFGVLEPLTRFVELAYGNTRYCELHPPKVDGRLFLEDRRCVEEQIIADRYMETGEWPL